MKVTPYCAAREVIEKNRPIKEVAREYHKSETTLRRWMDLYTEFQLTDTSSARTCGRLAHIEEFLKPLAKAETDGTGPASRKDSRSNGPAWNCWYRCHLELVDQLAITEI